MIMILLGVFVPSYINFKVIQNDWLNILNLFFLLILFLPVFDLLEKGILGPKYEIKNRNVKKWQEKYPRFSRFLQQHPRLPYAVLYGSICAYFTYAISMTIMNKYYKQWSALGLNYFKIDEPMASLIIRSEGLNSPLKSLLLVILIWSAVALVVAFICSLLVRDPAALRLGAIPWLAFYSLLMPAPLDLFQRLLVGSACATCAYISSRLCVLNLSERICSLFTVKDSNCIA